MDRTDLSGLVTSVTHFLDLSLSAVKGLKDDQAFNGSSIEDTLTDINTSLLFTRDILEREDDAAETSTFDKPTIDSLKELLDNLQSDLKRFSSKRQRFMRTMLRMPTSQLQQSHERIQESGKNLRALLKRLDSRKDINLETPVKKEVKGHDILFRKRPGRATRDIAKQHNRYQLHLQAREGSGDWLLRNQAYQDWLKEPGMILWLDGLAGSGKSVLSSIVIEHLQERQREPNSGIGIAFLFLGKSVAGASADRQLARWLGSGQKYPYLIGSIVQQLKGVTYQTRTGSSRPKVPRRESSDMHELPQLLQESINKFPHTYIIIDALDECSNENTRTLLIEKLREISPRIHLLVTSRPTVQSARAFPNAPQLVQLEVRPEDEPLTLKEFVASQMKSLELSPDDKDRLIDKILELSKEDFIMALLVCQQLKDRSEQLSSRGSEARFLELRMAAQAQPDDIGLLWRTLMSQIRKDELSMKLLQLVLFSHRPLKSDEIRAAISFWVDQLNRGFQVENAQPFQKGLLTRNSRADTVQLTHTSLREYLMSELDSYCSDPHSEIAGVCMRYMETHLIDEKIKWYPEISVLFSTAPNSPFLDYAASNWAYHVKRAQCVDIEKLTFLLNSPKVSGVLSRFIGSRGQIKTTIVKERMSGIHIVAHFGLVDVLKSLLGNETSNIDEKTSAGRTPLHVASASGRDQVVSFLLKHGASILEQTDTEKWTALHIAARKGHLSVIKELLGYQNSPTEQVGKGMALLHTGDKAKRTPLHLAASAGHARVVQYLIEQGSQIDGIDGMGSSPLHHATRSDHLDVVRILIEKGADLRKKDLVYKQTVTDLAWNRSDQDSGMSIRCALYEEDKERSKAVVKGGQATCRVLKRKGQEHQESKHSLIFQKTFDLTKDENGTAQKYLLTEHKLLKRLNHAHIVSYLDYEEHHDQNSFSLYMEYFDGGDLHRKYRWPSASKDTTTCVVDDFGFEVRPESRQSRVSSKSTRPLGETSVWALIYQLSLVIAYLHHGLNFSSDDEEAYFEKEWEYVMHRDIKPANVILKHSDGDKSIVAKLCDLGIARERGVGVSAPKTEIGSQGYMPPEFPTWTIKADIWAFGETIRKTYKVAESENESKGTPLQKLIKTCTKQKSAKRPSSLTILEQCYNHFEEDSTLKMELPAQTRLHIEATHRLLSNGKSYLLEAFRHVRNFLDDYSVFDSAAQNRRKAIVHRLNLFLEDGAEDLFRDNPEDDSTHLTVLLKFPSRKTAKKVHLEHLCQIQPNINHKWEKSGFTALHLAVQQGYREMVEILLQHGADTSIRDIHSQTAEDYAMSCGSEGIEELFKNRPSSSSGTLSEIEEEQFGTVEFPIQEKSLNNKTPKVTFSEAPPKSENCLVRA